MNRWPPVTLVTMVTLSYRDEGKEISSTPSFIDQRNECNQRNREAFGHPCPYMRADGKNHDITARTLLTPAGVRA